MISMLICSPRENELKYLTSCSKRLAETESDERWQFHCCRNEAELQEAVDEGDSYDIICVDIEMENAIEAAGKLKFDNPDAHVIIISGRSVSPAEYVVPSVMNSGLMLRPLTADGVAKSLKDNISAYLEKMYRGRLENCFILDSKDGRQLVPHNMISYFESREKKIFLYTAKNEYSFYDTLDRLEKALPEDRFVRCHRSFIINRDKISSIVVNKNLIMLDNGEMIPLSRTYRSVLKELK